MFELRVPISSSTAFIDRGWHASSNIFYRAGYNAGMQTTWFNISCTNRTGFAAASVCLTPINNWQTAQSWLLLFVLRVKKIERCAAVNKTLLEESEEKAHFVQYVGDNFNHDIATINGLNTFHGTGLIKVSTPELLATELSVPRKEVSGYEIKSIGTVPFYNYQKPTKPQPRTFVCLKNNEWEVETL